MAALGSWKHPCRRAGASVIPGAATSQALFAVKHIASFLVQGVPLLAGMPFAEVLAAHCIQETQFLQCSVPAVFAEEYHP